MVSSVFLPGSEIAFDLIARNLEKVDLALHPVQLDDALDLRQRGEFHDWIGEVRIDGSMEPKRVWGGALVQPRFPLFEEPKDYFDWRLFWIAMAGGTLFLIMVTFTILSRVVIRPVEVMATAVQNTSCSGRTT